MIPAPWSNGLRPPQGGPVAAKSLVSKAMIASSQSTGMPILAAVTIAWLMKSSP
jgi:hypothetical protein